MPKMKKYIKKPVEVEAIQFDKELWEIESGFGRATSKTYPMVKPLAYQSKITAIETLEGDMVVKDGDYIIKGVEGEYYPCKPSVFKKSYKKSEEENK